METYNWIVCSIEYIQGKKNILADALLRLTNNWNQYTTQESNYIKEILSEISDIDELSEGIFTINLKTIDQYRWKDASLMAKYKNGKYKSDSFCWGSNIYFNLIKCEDKIVIPLILQNYILNCYNMYIFSVVMDRT